MQELLKNGFKSDALDARTIQEVYESGVLDEPEDSHLLENPINKVRRGILKIRASTNFKRTFNEMCVNKYGENNIRVLLLDCPTR
jgi:predicted DNA-binding protein